MSHITIPYKMPAKIIYKPKNDDEPPNNCSAGSRLGHLAHYLAFFFVAAVTGFIAFKILPKIEGCTGSGLVPAW